MKKVLSLLFLLHIACFTAFSQTHKDTVIMMRDYVARNTDKFLTVKGVELKPGLKMDDMLKLMLNKGFKKSELFNMSKEYFGVYQLEGTFFNRLNCTLRIVPIQNNQELVSAVGINFPDAYSFKQLKSDYDDLKEVLSKKYHLYNSVEQFDDEYVEKSTSDYLKLSALEKNEGEFKSKFYVSDDPLSLLLGQVVLSISHVPNQFGGTSYYISITYATSDDMVDQMGSYGDDL